MHIDSKGLHFPLLSLTLTVLVLTTLGWTPVQAQPANDDFADAEELTLPFTDVTGSNLAATSETGEPQCSGDESVWYRMTPSSSGRLRVRGNGDGFTTGIGIYEGASVDALTELGCDNGRETVSVQAGTTYYLRIAARFSGQGDFTISGEVIPFRPNDDFADAVELTLPFTDVTGSNLAATSETGEPRCVGNESVWYRMTPSSAGRLRVRGNGDGFTTGIGIYEGTSVDALTQLGCNNDRETVSVQAGTTYYLRIAARFSGQGDFTISGEMIPFRPNDDFADADILTGLPATGIQGSNLAATSESDEPACGNSRSVWYEVRLQEKGRLRVTVTDANFPVVVGLYTGTSVDALTEAACGTAGEVASEVISATTFYVKVSGRFSSSEGSFTFSAVRLDPIPTETPAVASTPNPTDGAFGVPVRPRLEWAPVPRAFEYDVYVWPEGTTRPSSPTAETTDEGVTLPSDLTFGETYHWQVVAGNPNGTTDGPVWTFETGNAADLVVSSAEAPSTAVGGTEIEVAWTVTNEGLAGTRSGSWVDVVYLSRDDAISDDDATLVRVGNSTSLGPNESYRQTARARVPLRVQREGRIVDVREEDVVKGDYRVLVRTDEGRGGREVEAVETNNLAVGPEIAIALPNLPDVRATQIEAPQTLCYYPPPRLILGASSKSASSQGSEAKANAGSGGVYRPCPSELNDGSFTLLNIYSQVRYQYTWQGVNEGDAPAGRFRDALFFQRDSTFNSAQAVFLGNGVVTSGEIAPGETYTAVTRPLDPVTQARLQERPLPDSGYYFVVANNAGLLFEGAATENNVFRAPERTVQRSVPPSDVTAEALSLPATAQSSDSIDVTFTLRNLGPSAVPRAVVSYDLYLSDDDVLDPDADRRLGRGYYDNLSDGSLQPDASASVTARLRLPDGETGSFTVFVALDEEERLNEFIGGTLFRDNNVASTALDVTPADYPDLAPVRIDAPSTATVGGSIAIDYEVRNEGPGSLETPSFRYDALYLAPDDTWPGTEAARLLVRQEEPAPLASGALYQRDGVGTVPRTLASGTYYVYAVADDGDARFEADETNNVLRSGPLDVSARPQPDLVASLRAQPPTTAATGESVTVEWRVENRGTRATDVTSWIDAVLLSRDAAPSDDDLRLAEVLRTRPLADGAGYDASAEVVLPAARTGRHFLIVLADDGTQVDDGNRGNNAAVADAATDIDQAPPADLRVVSFTLQGAPQAGQPVRAEVTVINDGAPIPARTSWTDRWTLSPGTKASRETVTLLSQRIAGPLAMGADYTHTADLFLPEHATGTHLLTFTTDERVEVVEGGQRDNNVRARTTDIVLPPPVDLVVENVDLPAGAQPGETITITYDLFNRGTEPFQGIFYDAVNLSTDTEFGVDDARLAFARRSLTLEPKARRTLAMTVRLPEAGETVYVQNADPEATRRQADGTLPLGAAGNTVAALSGRAEAATAVTAKAGESAEGTVPNVVPGDYYALVSTDVRGGVRETDNNNNRASSANTVGLDVPEISLGQREGVQLLGDQERYFKLTVPAGRDLRLTLDNDTPFRDEEFELFAAAGRVPSPGDFDAAFFAEEALGEPELLVPNTEAATYFVLVRNPFLSAADGDVADVTLTAEAFTFRLFSATPDAGGTQGRVVSTIRGAQLTDDMAFFLEGAGRRIEGTLVNLLSSMEVEVRFDLRGTPVGTYDLVAEQPSGTTARLADGFAVEVPSAKGLRRTLVRPTGFVTNEPAGIELVAKNDGNADIDVAVVSVFVPGDMAFTLTSDDFVSSTLVPVSAGDVPETARSGIRVAVTLPSESTVDMAILTIMARDVRVGETLTAELRSPAVTITGGEELVVGSSARTYTREDFASMLSDNAGAVLNELDDNRAEIEPLAPDFYASLDANKGDALSLIRNNIDVYLDQVGLGATGALRGASTLTYRPDLAPTALSVTPAALAALAKASPKQCADLAAGLGIGIGIPALIIGVVLLPAEVTALAVVGVVAGAVSLAIALDSLISGRDWGLAGKIGFPASPLDLIPAAVNFACDPTFLSDDPNDILGPEGAGAAKWVAAETPLDYTIRFENNAETANAPARTVVVTQHLDADLDLRTLRVTAFGFSGRRFTLPGTGRAYYNDRLDLRETLGIFLDVSTSLDVSTRELRLELQSIDPETGARPRDPLKGFLPPNVTPPEGDGFFDYRIAPLPDAPHEARIDAQATIVFDANAPIDTPPIFNTLDALRPESTIDGLTATALDTTSVRLTWSGTDVGAGVGSFTLYARPENGDADTPNVEASFAPILTGLETTEAVFEGEPGRRYAFYTRASDRAGNLETEKTGGVVLPLPVASSRQTVVAGEGRVAFDRTGIDIVFSSGTVGSGPVRVLRYDAAPSNTSGISAANVSAYRVVITAGSGLSPGSDTELRFDVNRFRGIGNASTVTVYSRPTAGTGDFSPLPTRIVGDELVATVSGFSEFVLASNDEENPLPVEMTGFVAETEEEDVLLTWQTASETNSAGFYVETSRLSDKDASTADSVAQNAWRELAFVESAGTTTELRRYAFRAKKVGYGRHAFRLRQVDLDGTSTVLKPLEVDVALLTPYIVDAYPNPFRGGHPASINIVVREAQAVRVDVYDILGRRVATLFDGEMVASSRKSLRLNGQRLGSGSYFVLVTGERFRTTRRLVLIR